VLHQDEAGEAFGKSKDNQWFSRFAPPYRRGQGQGMDISASFHPPFFI
jgi:hypothetical protein